MLFLISPSPNELMKAFYLERRTLSKVQKIPLNENPHLSKSSTLRGGFSWSTYHFDKPGRVLFFYLKRSYVDILSSSSLVLIVHVSDIGLSTSLSTLKLPDGSESPFYFSPELTIKHEALGAHQVMIPAHFFRG